jgi:HAD superfamily hydrolase (TIGR01509 family)
MRSFLAVAWDVDGTLVDSEPLHHRALLAGSLRWGVDLSDLPEQQFRGIHMADVWAALRPRMPADLGPADWLAAINAYYIANSGDLKPLPGVVQTVAALAARGIPQVCVSNSSRPVVRANLAALGLSSYLAFAISLDDVSNGKPDPEPYLRVVERLQLQPNEVLAVEDSRTGVASAVAAGMTVALCADLPIERPDLVTHVVDIAEILGWPGLWRSTRDPPVQAPLQGPPVRKGDGSTR